MKYKSKGYVFDEEVTAWLDKLKAMHGSYNKGLRLVAFPGSDRHPAIEAEVVAKPGLIDDVKPIDFTVKRDDEIVQLDAIGPELSGGRGKASTEVVRRGPRQKGDKTW